MATLRIETSQLEPVPQLSVGTAAAGRKMKVLGQAPRLELQFGQHPAKFPHPTFSAARAGAPTEPLRTLPLAGRDQPTPLPRHPLHPW